MKIFILFVFFFLVSISGLNSQTFVNGLYGTKPGGYFFYLNCDSIILAIASPVHGYTIYKGKFEDNNRLRFISVPNKFENIYEILSVSDDSTRSKIRFNIYRYFYEKKK